MSRCGACTRWLSIVILAVCGWCALLLAEDDPTHSDGVAEAADAASFEGAAQNRSGSPPRLREGMHLSDAVGHFERTSEGAVFVHGDGYRLAGLENLNLQRIARTLMAAEDPESVSWRVSGLITEYEGRNFILIERAVYSPSHR